MPKRPGVKMNEVQKRNKSLKKTVESLQTTAIQNAFNEYEDLKKAVVYSAGRVKALKRQRVIAIGTIVALLAIAATDTYLLISAYNLGGFYGF